MKRSGRSRRPAALPTAFVSVFAVVWVLAVAGCGKRGGVDTPESAKAGPKADPWESAARQIRKENGLPACKAILGQLNNDLAEQPERAGPSPHSDEAAKKLSALVPLSADDMAEVRRPAFSSLDPAYLAECFYLHDAAQSLDPTNQPIDRRVRVAFEWVCRQISIKPWLIHDHQVPAIPPTYALRRGFGTGLDRAYIFLALLQQMGLDGCLIGPPEAGEKMTFDSDVRPKGPFWAVGARMGANILLFDPWRGAPFPGPGGKGIGTLAQVRANPDQMKTWLEDKTRPWDVKPSDLEKGEVFLAAPLSALSTRIAFLESKIKSETGVKLAFDPEAVKARFAAGAPEGPGADRVRYWNPPQDRFTYTRNLIAFLPIEEGGLDRAEPSERLYSQYLKSMVPSSLTTMPQALKALLAKERLHTVILTVYGSSFLGASGPAIFAFPTPRERIQRGRFQDAARDLTEKLQDFGRGRERLRSLDSGEIAAWCEAANAVYDNLNQKRFPSPGQLAPQPDTDPDVIDARNAVEEFWRSRDVGQLLVDRATAAIGLAEASYLLALAKHEEAERLEARRDGSARVSEAAGSAWREAVNAWQAFLEKHPPSSQDQQTIHAKELAARAERFAQQAKP